MIHERIQNFFRPAYEARAAVGWAFACTYSLLLLMVLRLSAVACAAMAGMAFVMFLWRASQARRLWVFKVALAGQVRALSA